jgi:hypothetical protein
MTSATAPGRTDDSEGPGDISSRTELPFGGLVLATGILEVDVAAFQLSRLDNRLGRPPLRLFPGTGNDPGFRCPGPFRKPAGRPRVEHVPRLDSSGTHR